MFQEAMVYNEQFGGTASAVPVTNVVNRTILESELPLGQRMMNHEREGRYEGLKET